MFLNKALVLGNITRDPELKKLPNGSSVCNFSIATNRVWTAKDGSKQEDTQFHNIVCFGKTADNVARYMNKGSSILIQGRIQTRSWEKDGIKRYSTEIVADQVQFGPKKVENNQSGSQDGGNYEENTSQEISVQPSIDPQGKLGQEIGQGQDEEIDIASIPF